MRPYLALLLALGGCIVPQGAGSGTPSAKVEKEPEKYISDAGQGVAFVRCVRDDSFFSNPTDLTRLVAEGCQASLSVALTRYPEIVDVDPLVVEGTTVGYTVLYAKVEEAPVAPASAPSAPAAPESNPSPVVPAAPTTPAAPY